VRISRWGAFVGEGEAGFTAFGGVEEAAIRVSFDAESEDEVADGDFGGAVLSDVGLQVFGVDDFHGFERTDAVDFFLAVEF
jgi:hypothetical protein